MAGWLRSPASAASPAAVITAEIGIDMSRFPYPGHLISGVKFAPRVKESAARKKGELPALASRPRRRPARRVIACTPPAHCPSAALLAPAVAVDLAGHSPGLGKAGHRYPRTSCP
jgi:hypothetical protein